MRLEALFAKPSATGIFWGIIGGLSLIIATIFTTNGYLQIVPYFFILCAAVLTTKYIYKADVNFQVLFISSFFAFIISSVFLYAYLLTVVNPNSEVTFIGHMLRFAIIAGMGLISSLIISFLAKPVK